METRWVSSVKLCWEARGKALRYSAASSPSRGVRAGGAQPSRENIVSVGESQKRQQPKHTGQTPASPGCQHNCLCGCQGARCRFWKKYLPGLALPGRPACHARRGGGCRVWAGCLAPQKALWAFEARAGTWAGGGGEDASKIFLLKIFWSRRRSFFFFSRTLAGKPKSY